MRIMDSAWKASAAYLYVLQLEPAALAWEYLRRNPDYQRDWERAQAVSDWAGGSAAHWGCSFFEDPRHDARTAQPVWLDMPPLVCLTPDGNDQAPRFSLWRIARSKALFHDGCQLLLVGMAAWRAVRMALALSLEEDSLFAYAMPVGASTAEYARAIDPVTMLLGTAPRQVRALAAPRPSRTALVHMRALQVLDAVSAGASHRDIAVVLHGESDVALRWEPDGDLRAQVRYLVKRGKALVNGDYRELMKNRRSGAGGKSPVLADSP